MIDVQNMKERVHEQILTRVQKPSRYLGSEVNAVHKEPASVRTRFCLAFPDMYDLGLSNLGLLILYNVLNAREDVWCERAYAPALDLEEILRAEGLPLFSVESKTPLKDFDLLGFTLQYELSYTNILNMLELGGIPVFAADRTDQDPIVVGGGPCVFNPEPLAPFFDAFGIGDGEDVILDMTDTVQRLEGHPRADVLKALSAIPGTYVPSLFPTKSIPGGFIVPDLDKTEPIRKRLVQDLNEAAFPTRYIVPFTEQAHDRVSLEVLRGCTQSCRFCQAGMTTRPVRERSLENLDRLMRETVDRTGYEEIALSSLSTCDYSQIRGLVAQSVTTALQRGASVSLPSLRSDSFSVDLSDMVRTIRQTGLTFAPEAATNRMRAVINKWILDEDLVAMTGEVYARGWDTVKLYFMIGLPTETDEDVEAIAHLSNRVHKNGRALNPRAKVNLGVSTFIPKPHTPFQWDRQIGPEETRRKQEMLRGLLGRHGPKFGRHDAQMSYLEGIISRGDRRVANLLFIAWKNGARFDGWSEHFNMDLWDQAIAQWGLDPEAYTGEIPLDRELPWDHIDVLVTKNYHLQEYEASRHDRLTSDCRYTRCNDCGVIHAETRSCATMLKTTREGIKIEANWKRPAHLGGAVPASASTTPQTAPTSFFGQEGSRNAAIRKGQGGAPILPMGVEEQQDFPAASSEKPAVKRFVLTYAKHGDLRFLSHLELNSAFQRALRRAGISVAMSQGFHPLPRLAFATPLRTGMESWAELADITLTEEMSGDDLMRRINETAPAGLTILKAEEQPLNASSLMSRVEASEYEVIVPRTDGARADLDDRVRAFLSGTEHVVTREGKNGPKSLNIRPLVQDLRYASDDTGHHLTMRLADSSSAKGRPEEVVSAVLGASMSGIRVRKTRTLLSQPNNGTTSREEARS